MAARGKLYGKDRDGISRFPVPPVSASPSLSSAVFPIPPLKLLAAHCPSRPSPGGRDSIDSRQLNVPKRWYWLDHDPQAKVTVKSA